MIPSRPGTVPDTLRHRGLSGRRRVTLSTLRPVRPARINGIQAVDPNGARRHDPATQIVALRKAVRARCEENQQVRGREDRPGNQIPGETHNSKGRLAKATRVRANEHINRKLLQQQARDGHRVRDEKIAERLNGREKKHGEHTEGVPREGSLGPCA